MNPSKRVGVAAITFAFLFPFCTTTAHAAGQGHVPGPVYGPMVVDEYSAVCQAGYRAGQGVFDPVMAMGPAWAATVETALCGEVRHS